MEAPAESSAASPEWYKEACMLGIDEAGRGPVLGPMVYAAAWCPLSDADSLRCKGFADSKTLTEEKRERLFAAIQAEPRLSSGADCLLAALISGRMLAANKTSLNALAMGSTCALIQRALEAGVNLAEVYVDTVGDAGKHRDALAQRFPGIAFIVCPKADAIYPIVSAASIVAKVTRDRAIRAEAAALAPTLAAASVAASGGDTAAPAAEEGACAATAAAPLPPKLGSGYPGDPLTKGWLEASVDPVFGWPALVRFSWSTCAPILEQKAVPVRWECEAEDASQSKLSFRGVQAGGGGATSGAGRHSYWRARKLQRVAVF